MTTDQENELLQLIREIVELHEERGCVLTIHIENLKDLLSEIDGARVRSSKTNHLRHDFIHSEDQSAVFQY